MLIYAAALLGPAAVLVGAAIYFTRVQWRAQRSEDARREQALANALQREYELDPRYQAKVESDRHFWLAQRDLTLREFQTFTQIAVSQYGTLVPPDVGASWVRVEPVYKPVAQEQQKQIAAPSLYQQPSLDWLLGQLEENSFTVSPGIRASDGELVTVDITKVPHLKIIGSTGFGKSCLAAAMMLQATELNSEDNLQLALLDLEHKTSRLLEHVPHIARLTVGNRTVDMVATNADEVVEHLGYLKRELDRRTKLTGPQLAREPVLLMYVEEMLALQYEEIPEPHLSRMFKDLTLLAVRGRKYLMFLLACMQTDYSTKEMQITQKMFRFRSAAAIDTTAARAAGFMNTDLIKENFSTGKPGQFVVEYPSFSGIVLAPLYDVERELVKLDNGRDVSTWEPDTGRFQAVKGPRSTVETSLKLVEIDDETSWKAKVDEVRALRHENNWGKIAIIEKVWREKPGGTIGYQRACEEYEQIVQDLEQEGA